MGNTSSATAAWSYAKPSAPYAVIKDYFAFHPSRTGGCQVAGEEVNARSGGLYGGWITSRIDEAFQRWGRNPALVVTNRTTDIVSEARYMAETMMSRSSLKVFYDGRCTFCGREIAHYAKLDEARDSVHWIDITQDMDLLAAIGVSTERAMKRVHVLDSHGMVREAAEAFLALWPGLPYYRWLARAVHFTRTVGILEACYRPFTDWRYARRARQGVCNVVFGSGPNR